MNYLPATSGVSQGTSLSGARVDAPHPAPRADAAPAHAAARRQGRSLSVGQKLAASFGILGLAVALLGATTWMTGEGTGRQAALLTAEQLPIERSVRDWKTQSVAIGQIALRATLSSDVFPLVAEMRTQLAAEDAQRKRIEEALAQASTAESTKPLWAQAQRQRYAVLRDALVQNALEAKIISQKELQEHAAALAQYLQTIDQLLAASE